MRPGEGNSDDGQGHDDRGKDMPERQPPTRQHQPDDVADHAERPGADVGLSGVGIARHRFLAERKQGVDRDIERGPGPGQADDRDRHDDRGDQPADSHPCAADDDPENIQEQ